jgi:hypothetical protein
MVKLNSEGEIEWQQCYGGLNDEEVSLGIIKKSDYNWVIAGSFIYNTGDIDCTWHGLNDYWVFEIKDPSVSIVEEEINERGIRVYPNPARDYVVFEIQESYLTGRQARHKIQEPRYKNQDTRYKNHDIIITNIFGQQVALLHVKTEKTVWDTRKLPGGSYHYFLHSDSDIIDWGKILIIK